MTIEEHLLTILAEECAEVIKECTKALRFGLDDSNPDVPAETRQKNRERIAKEIEDVRGVVMMLEARGILRPSTEWAVRRKADRVFEWLDYSNKVGTLQKAS